VSTVSAQELREVEIIIDGSCLGNPVRAVGRAYFGAVNMSASCKEVCRTRRTIEWSSLLQSRGCAPLSGLPSHSPDRLRVRASRNH